MGLLTGLLTLPLAPMRGTMWVVEQVAAAAERELDDDAQARRLLIEAEIAFEAGRLTEEQYEQIEDELLDRLELPASREVG